MERVDQVIQVVPSAVTTNEAPPSLPCGNSRRIGNVVPVARKVGSRPVKAEVWSVSRNGSACGKGASDQDEDVSFCAPTDRLRWLGGRSAHAGLRPSLSRASPDRSRGTVVTGRFLLLASPSLLCALPLTLFLPFLRSGKLEVTYRFVHKCASLACVEIAPPQGCLLQCSTDEVVAWLGQQGWIAGTARLDQGTITATIQPSPSSNRCDGHGRGPSSTRRVMPQ